MLQGTPRTLEEGGGFCTRLNRCGGSKAGGGDGGYSSRSDVDWFRCVPVSHRLAHGSVVGGNVHGRVITDNATPT